VTSRLEEDPRVRRMRKRKVLWSHLVATSVFSLWGKSWYLFFLERTDFLLILTARSDVWCLDEGSKLGSLLGLFQLLLGLPELGEIEGSDLLSLLNLLLVSLDL